MAKNATGPDRIAKYTNRLFYDQSKAIPKVMEDQKLTILALETLHFNNMVQFEAATKTILDEEAVSIRQYPAYLNFSRRCYAATQKYNGNTLISFVNQLLQYFVSRGFTQAILERIRNEVWTISPPGP